MYIPCIDYAGTRAEARYLCCKMEGGFRLGLGLSWAKMGLGWAGLGASKL